MADIVYDAYGEQIEYTKEQESCVNYSGSKTLLVKGLAGAGKSVVLEGLAKKLKEEYGEKAGRKVAIFTYQNTLVSATKERLELNGEADETIFVSTVNSYVKEIYEVMVSMGVVPRVSYPSQKNADYLAKKNVERALSEHKSKFGAHTLQNKSVKFWYEEFVWMKGMNVWTDNIGFFVNLKRVGRGASEVPSMNVSEKMVAYQIFKIYCDNLAKQKLGDWEDQNVILLRNENMIPEGFKFDVILIDEAQDLSLAQLLVLKALARKQIYLAMDANQRIHSKHWNNKLLGIDPVVKKLTKSMRTTVQIDALAESIRKNNDVFLPEEEKVQRAIPERSENKPIVAHLVDELAEEKYVIETINSYLKSGKPMTIGVIVSKNDLITKVSDWIASAGISYEKIQKNSTYSVKSKGVKVVSSYSSKGLEFDVVIMPLFIEGYYPYKYNPKSSEAYNEFMVSMRNLVYVSMTRAKHELLITYHGKTGSRVIGEMDPDTFEPSGDVSLSTYVKGRAMAIKETILESYENEALPVPASEVKELPKATPVSKKTGGIKEIFENAGFTVIDHRPAGNLTIIGTKSELEPYVKEAKDRFGAIGSYKDSLKAAHGKPGWWTISKH